MPQVARIAGLFIYPIKGCGGIALESARLTERGLQHDRRWMIVDPGGRFRTQRELPKLATIRLRPVGDEFGLRIGDAPEFRLAAGGGGDPVPVRVWRDPVQAAAVDPAIDRALTAWLGAPMRLVHFPDEVVRPCDPEFAPPGSHTGFADGFPLLVTSAGSLAELNDELRAVEAGPVPMDRFRPNVVLAEVPAGAEDRHAALELAEGSRLDFVKACDRCIVTTIDQASGIRTGDEPLTTLKRFRRNPRTGKPRFGQNAVPRLAAGATPRLTVGDLCILRDA